MVRFPPRLEADVAFCPLDADCVSVFVLVFLELIPNRLFLRCGKSFGYIKISGVSTYCMCVGVSVIRYTQTC